MFLHSGKESNFKKKKIQEVTGLGLPYDYDGVMHYGAYAFAKNRSKPTIVKVKNTGGPIGQRKGFSSTDLKQINLLYDCQSTYSTLCSHLLKFEKNAELLTNIWSVIYRLDVIH